MYTHELGFRFTLLELHLIDGFQEDLLITAMKSADGETVPFDEPMYPKGNVEDWLLMVRTYMLPLILTNGYPIEW